jgi:hypothetical protein
MEQMKYSTEVPLSYCWFYKIKAYWIY